MVGVAVLLVVPPAAGFTLPERLRVAPDAVPLICTGVEPEVCVARGHDRGLDRIREGVASAQAVLAAAGVVVSPRLEERSPQAPVRDAGVLELPSSDLNLADFSSDQYAHAVVVPTDCPAFASDPTPASDDLLALQAALATWVASRLDGSLVPADDRIARRPAEWARAAYSALLSCTAEPPLLEGRSE